MPPFVMFSRVDTTPPTAAACELAQSTPTSMSAQAAAVMVPTSASKRLKDEML
jgi:hypothetical protein